MVAAVAGCSFTVRGPDPAAPVSAEPTCDASAPGLALLDATAAVLHGGTNSGFGFLVCMAGENATAGRCGWLSASAGVITAIPYVAAILYARRRTKACRRAWTRHEEWSTCEEFLVDLRNEPVPARQRELRDQMPESCQRYTSDPDVLDREQQARAAYAAIRCERDLARWRQEPDRWRKGVLYEQMDGICRHLADQELRR